MTMFTRSRWSLIVGILLFTCLFVSAKQQQEASREVASLERVASGDGSDDTENTQMGQSGKEHRTAAYIRLGAMGTPESLEAARRVEKKFRSSAYLPAKVSLGVWQHPMWHFGDSETKPSVKTQAADGVT